MKTLITLTLLICITVSYAQEVDNVNYKSTEVSIYLNGERKDLAVETNFQFRGNHIQTTGYGQLKNFYLVEDWKDTVYSEPLKGLPVKVVQAVDNGGFYCPITIGKLKGTYFIVVAYKNIDFLYVVEPTNDIIDNSVFELPDHEMSNREYTDAEVTEFLRKFGNPGLVGDMWVYDFLFGDENKE